jgi:hypothetical protein
MLGLLAIGVGLLIIQYTAFIVEGVDCFFIEKSTKNSFTFKSTLNIILSLIPFVGVMMITIDILKFIYKP